MSELLKCPDCGGTDFIARVQQYAFYKVNVDSDNNIDLIDIISDQLGDEEPTEVFCKPCGKDFAIADLRR